MGSITTKLEQSYSEVHALSRRYILQSQEIIISVEKLYRKRTASFPNM